MPKKLSNSGFSVVEVVVVLFVVAALGLGGFFVWHYNKDDSDKDKSSNTNQSTSNSDSDSQPPKTDDQYAGWKTYESSTYGLSFKYPSDWKVTEGPITSSASSTQQEYEIDLKRDQDVKYNATLSIEVLGEDLATATVTYDKNDSSSKQVTRTTDALKGKQSVQYMATNDSVPSRLYLFAVGGKTYVVSSINEELNAQTDSDYWTKFGKVFDSLQID